MPTIKENAKININITGMEIKLNSFARVTELLTRDVFDFFSLAATVGYEGLVEDLTVFLVTSILAIFALFLVIKVK